MKYKAGRRYRIKVVVVGLLLASLVIIAYADNIAYVAKTSPGDTATAGVGKQWPTTRFVVNGDCVTDNLTGLMWAKNGNLLGAGTWGSSATAGTAQYKVAQMNTDSNATGYQLCGYTDWRLPNINELGSLINYAAKQNASKPSAWLNSQGFANVQPAPYWSSNAYDSNSISAWYINFEVGNYYVDTVGLDRYVWAVRGGQ